MEAADHRGRALETAGAGWAQWDRQRKAALWVLAPAKITQSSGRWKQQRAWRSGTAKGKAAE